jgi:Fe-S cluster assembly protein SufB
MTTFFAALNSAVFSDGSFCYIPKGVRCPDGAVHLFPHQHRRQRAVRAHPPHSPMRAAQVSYLEGLHRPPCATPTSLHAAVVELIALEKRHHQIFHPCKTGIRATRTAKGGIYNFVTKRGKCAGRQLKNFLGPRSRNRLGSITWKYPGVILLGDNSVGEFYSVALTNHRQQADTGTKMIHVGKNTSSTIVSKGISAGRGQNSYRGLVKILKSATGSRNYSQCDSLLMGDRCGAHTFPYVEVRNSSSTVEHEACTSKIGEDQIFYCNQRGISTQDAVNMIVNGYCKEVFKQLPMEFAVEAQKLLGVSLEGSVG